MTRIVTDAANQALNNLEPDIETLRDEITGQTIGHEAVDDLEKARAVASDLVLQGESLESANPAPEAEASLDSSCRR